LEVNWIWRAEGIRVVRLAGLLGVGRSTLYDWIEAGTIPSYRHRGVIFFDPVVVAGWLRQQATVMSRACT
jgi:excisionase family DNA binding protein